MLIKLAHDRVQCWAAYSTVSKLSGSIKGKEFFDQLSDYQFLKKDSAA
jgi:hypothetical protein